MPFGPYGSFEDCVSKNGDKSSPEGFCAWLEHKITGAWPGEMSRESYPEEFWTAYDGALSTGKSEKEAFAAGETAATQAGYEKARFGWVKQFQAPKMKNVTGVKVFAAGTWTDSAGVERTWSPEDLDKICEAFTAGVPAVVPLKCGHTTDAFNRKIAEALDVPPEVITGEQGQGQVSLGRMTSLEHKGNLLVAAFDKVPEAIANLIEGGQFSTVSVEIEDAVGDFGPVITGVALLGAEEPAVSAATLERALVFAKRPGANVWSFKVGDQIPTSQLRKLKEQVNALFEKAFGNHGKPDGQLPGKPPAEGSGNTEGEPNEKEKGGNHQMDELKKIAAALGLGEAATIEDILAAIKALAEGAAAMPGEMAAELKKATDRIAALEAANKGQTSLAAWKEKTANFTNIPGTALEHATKLADIEAKAGKDAADASFAALESANKLAGEALKVVGTSRTSGPTDFDTEVAKYQKDNPTVSRGDAIKFVAKARPELYHARRA